MNKKRNFLIASCLLCASMAVVGMAACSDKEAETPPTSSETTEASTGREDFGYAPDITVAWGDYSAENIPQAVKNKPYKLFEATAEDLYSAKLNVTTRVYLHYLEDTRALMTVTENVVTPVSYGIYTVEYSAVDEFGNVGIYTYDFECKDVDTLSVVLSGQMTNTLAGVETPIACYAYDNQMGNVQTTITARHKDGKAVYDLTGKSSFLPMYAGQYTIEYACTDYNVTVTESYDVTVEKNPDPVFFSEVDLQKYFIVGKTYTLPLMEAYQFSTGEPVPFTPVIFVQRGNGMLKQLSGCSFTPDKEGSLKFIYKISCNGKEVTKEYTAQAIDVGETDTTFDITKYFYGAEAEVTAGDDALTVATSTDGATIEFANTLASRKFSLTLSTAVETTSFDSIDISLKDSKDASIQLKITYANPLQNGYICLNGGAANETNLYESAAQKITYDEATNEVSLNGALFISCPQDFNGFPSGRMNWSLQFNGVKGPTELKLLALNNQTLCYWPGDYFAPEIWFEVPAKNVCAIGETVKLGAIEYADVLDPETNLYLSVLSPSGEYVTSEEGLLMKDHQGVAAACSFRTVEYGEYIVRMKVVDGCGNNKTYNYVITVKDLIGPKVEFVTKMAKKVKVGEAFTLSGVTVTDDLSASDKCTVSVTLIGGPIGDVRLLTPGKTYTFQTKGVYYLYYRVADERLNTTTLCHKFIVE